MLAASWLEESEVKVAAVVGFPLGANDADTKRFETESAVDLGAQEIDVVMNIGRLKDVARNSERLGEVQRLGGDVEP